MNTTESSSPEKASVVDDLVSPEVRALEAYHVESPGNMVKLDAMENPYGIPDELRGEWQDRLGKVVVNRYPDPSCSELRSVIREALGIIPAGSKIVLGNGSDELIQIIAMLVGGTGRTFVSPEPGFSMYRQICSTTGTKFASVGLESDFSLDPEKMLAAISEHSPAAVFLAYPNNPTGNCFPSDTVELVMEAAPGLVVLDEAYFPFCGKTFLNRIADYPNLVVLRTLSKSGLAGLRLGMLVGNKTWTGEMEKLRLPYNVSSLTQASATFFLQHQRVFDAQAENIVVSRETLYTSLAAIPGVRAWPSETNFVLARFELGAERVFTRLCNRGILVRNLHRKGTALENCLRITVGTEHENKLVIDALKGIVREAG